MTPSAHQIARALRWLRVSPTRALTYNETAPRHIRETIVAAKLLQKPNAKRA